MLISVFNAVLIVLVTWLAYRYFELRERTSPTEERYSQFVSGVASIVDRIEGYDAAHSLEVAQTAEKIAAAAGFEGEQLQALKAAAMLHDVGETLLPREILRTAERLNDEQTYLMRTHPLLGELHLKSRMQAPDEVPAIIRWHHERWDGLGYPDNLKGEEIPKAARILAIADAISAMRHSRSYRLKQYKSQKDIDAEIERQAGLQFDPELAALWLKLSPAAGNN
ncbi:MAG TPA: HD domain-containing protein [Candidatus Ozemobacteraceae bacterium]|nr:HD domain-containing protein [Candidatus Ozemobacteraceae bacterium]